ncbi:Lar family restriction alleviation protein [Achromobacter denitrificans]|uniref:Lar family restriction alleviation protein n=1 Tax=Achromobacter denitrificans TaxID=32002 RepID=UPI003B9DE9C0
MTNRAEFERLLDVYGFRCERFGQDLSTHARAQVVSAFAALASAPVADEREPLPCPFCGGRAFATYKTDEDDIRWHSVHCRTECRGYGKHGSEKDAIAAWNTRTTLLRKYPNDEEIIDLAVEPLGIDCDRMPHGVVVFARNLLSRYAAPQASEAVRNARGVLEAWQAVCDRIVDQYGGVVAGVDFAALGRTNRAALSAQPGAQRTGGSDAG